MEQIVIERSLEGYSLRSTSSSKQAYQAGTLAEIFQKQAELFSHVEPGISVEPAEADKIVLRQITTELIKYLHTCGLKPSKIAAILMRLQSDIQKNLIHTINRGNQVELEDIGAFTDQVYGFMEAEPFDTNMFYPERYNSLFMWDFNGRYGIKKKGSRQEVFVSKQEAKHLKSLSQDDFEQSIADLPEEKRQIITEFIETLKDIEIGAYPLVSMNTRIMPDAGELNAEVMAQFDDIENIDSID